MLIFALVLLCSGVGVLCQRCTVPTYPSCPGSYNQIIYTRDPYESPPILPCEGYYMPQTAMPINVVPETVYYQQTYAPEIAMPVLTTPVCPFITELPNCPDICFNEILASPLGCLDPILNIYSMKEVCPLPELPVSPLSTPISALASPFSKLLPPVSDCDCYNSCLTRAPIPPPFI